MLKCFGLARQSRSHASLDGPGPPLLCQQMRCRSRSRFISMRIKHNDTALTIFKKQQLIGLFRIFSLASASPRQSVAISLELRSFGRVSTRCCECMIRCLTRETVIAMRKQMEKRLKGGRRLGETRRHVRSAETRCCCCCWLLLLEMRCDHDSCAAVHLRLMGVNGDAGPLMVCCCALKGRASGEETEARGRAEAGAAAVAAAVALRG